MDISPTYLLTAVGASVARIALWLLVESRWRVYPSSWRASLAGDLITTLILGLVTVPLADRLAYRIGMAGWLPSI